MHVFVRDWVSSNNVLLKGSADAVVIDTGYASHVPLTLALLASRQGLDGAMLTKIVNTHCHSDHMGGNAAIARAYRCAIAIPTAEAPSIEAWDTKALLLDYADQTADRFVADEMLEPGATYVWGDLEWRALAAPGHDMAALVFYNAKHRIMISGDALWQNGYGLVMPPEIDPAAMPATRATLEMLASLDIRVVIPGHGEPFSDVQSALDRAFKRTAAFEADPRRFARHALKVVLSFSLLERRRLPLAELPGYVGRVEIYRDFNARFFRLPPSDLAAMLVADLEKSDVVKRHAGFLTPA